MLKQRIITALLLLAVALPALFHSNPQWLGGFGLVLILAAAWEWGRLNGVGARWALLIAPPITGTTGQGQAARIGQRSRRLHQGFQKASVSLVGS